MIVGSILVGVFIFTILLDNDGIADKNKKYIDDRLIGQEDNFRI